MLKRQRQPSPPPSSADIPLVSDSPGDYGAERNFKKLRTAPPALDGRTRGWGREQGLPTEEDEEEDYIDDDGDDLVPGPSTAGYGHPPPPPENEYKSANNFLRELHTLHQHRMLFATPQSSGSQNHTVAHTSAPLIHGPSPLRNQIGKDNMTAASNRQPYSSTEERSLGNDGSMLDDEANRVAERYEGLNKMLGSYVLSRRRTLHSSDEIPEP